MDHTNSDEKKKKLFQHINRFRWLCAYVLSCHPSLSFRTICWHFEHGKIIIVATCVRVVVLIIRHGHIKCLFIHYYIMNSLATSVSLLSSILLYSFLTRCRDTLNRIYELCFRIHSHSRAPNTTSTKIWIIARCDTIDFYRVHWRPQLKFDIDEFERRARFESNILACYRFIR